MRARLLRSTSHPEAPLPSWPLARRRDADKATRIVPASFGPQHFPHIEFDRGDTRLNLDVGQQQLAPRVRWTSHPHWHVVLIESHKHPALAPQPRGVREPGARVHATD